MFDEDIELLFQKMYGDRFKDLMGEWDKKIAKRHIANMIIVSHADSSYFKEIDKYLKNV